MPPMNSFELSRLVPFDEMPEVDPDEFQDEELSTRDEDEPEEKQWVED